MKYIDNPRFVWYYEENREYSRKYILKIKGKNMGKSDITKQEIKKTTKKLIIEKGYSSVTMNDICLHMRISAGGLYYHYHSVEEILQDIIESETEDIWSMFDNIESQEQLMEMVHQYFVREKRDYMRFDETLSGILYEYYFSFPVEKRKEVLYCVYEDTYKKISDILENFIDRTSLKHICNHLYLTLQGLSFMAMSKALNEEMIDYEFQMLKDEIERNLI